METNELLNYALIGAVALGETDALASLVKDGANVNAVNGRGQGPLHHAARLGSCGVVTQLIRHGADVNMPDESKRTPLHYAAYAAHTAAFSPLIEAGANVDAIDADGLTPRMVATRDTMPLGVDVIFNRAVDTRGQGTEHQIAELDRRRTGNDERSARR